MEDFEWYRYRRRRIAAFSLGLLLTDDERSGKRGKTRQWIKRRQQKGFCANIVQELMVEDVAGYRVKVTLDHTTNECMTEIFLN